MRSRSRRHGVARRRRRSVADVRPGAGPARRTCRPGSTLRLSNGKQGAAGVRSREARAGDASSPTPTPSAARARASRSRRDAGDQQAFALRPGSQPPPRTGADDQGELPAAGVDAAAAAPRPTPARTCASLRYMPEGKVPLAPELSMTFSQPMVAVTSQDDAAAIAAGEAHADAEGHVALDRHAHDPVRSRRPRSRRRRRIRSRSRPARSRANGGVLEDGREVHVRDAGADAGRELPGRRRAAARSTCRCSCCSIRRSIRRRCSRTIKRHRRTASAGRGCELARRARRDREGQDARATLVARRRRTSRTAAGSRSARPSRCRRDAHDRRSRSPPGTPSAEGPNKTHGAADVLVPHVSAARVVDARVRLRRRVPRRACRSAFVFNNPLDVDKFDDAQVTVTPAIPDVQDHRRAATRSSIIGATEARTHVQGRRSAAQLVDEFGQTLGKDDDARRSRSAMRTPTFFGPRAWSCSIRRRSSRRSTSSRPTTSSSRSSSTRSSPSDFDAYGALHAATSGTTITRRAMPGKKVFDQLVKTTARHERARRDHRSISRRRCNGRARRRRSRSSSRTPWNEQYEPPRLIAWVQATQARRRRARRRRQPRRVRDRPRAPASRPRTSTLEIRPYGITGTTDDKGIATLALGTGAHEGRELPGRARAATTPRSSPTTTAAGTTTAAWIKQPRGDAARLVRRSTIARCTSRARTSRSRAGCARSITARAATSAALAGAVDGGRRTRSPTRSGNQIATGTAQVDAVGGFDTKFTLPKTPNLGYAHVELRRRAAAIGGSYAHAFQIEEFRRPEFEVSAHASQGPFLVGGGGDVTVDAKYYAGGPLPGAPRRLVRDARARRPSRRRTATTTCSATGSRGGAIAAGTTTTSRRASQAASRRWTLAGKTDATGAHVLHIDFLSVNPAMPMSVDRERER